MPPEKATTTEPISCRMCRALESLSISGVLETMGTRVRRTGQSSGYCLTLALAIDPTTTNA